MLNKIDKLLNSITMYKLVLYGLLLLSAISIILGFAKILPFSGLQLLTSLLILSTTCFITNQILTKIYKAFTNSESYLITALILFFIMAPTTTLVDVYTLILAGTIAMASKFVLALHKKHIFNPAAISGLILGVAGSAQVIWWVGSTALLPLVLILGLLVVKKIRRAYLFISFLVTSLATILFVGFLHVNNLSQLFIQAVTSWPLVFFGTIMLTEPLTTPPSKKLQIIYGALVGLILGIPFSLGPLYSTPEFALIIGNIFSYLVSPKAKFILHSPQKFALSKNIYEFIFCCEKTPKFLPGQYMEWTLPHKNADSRGNRRYFTVASSPTEKNLKLGVRIDEKGSSFKKALLNVSDSTKLMVGGAAGDFVLPDDPTKKLVFIAGGIGITPFRSMIKFLIDKQQKRDITLFFACADPEFFVYKNIFEEAKNSVGLKPIYVLTDASKKPEAWSGKLGRINPDMITVEVTDYKECMYYLSGPNAMVVNYKKMLLELGIHRKDIVTDYFPGF